MPLYIYDPKVIERIAEVEGADWAKSQRTGSGMGCAPEKCGYSVRAYADAWAKLQELIAEGEEWGEDNLDPGALGGPQGDRMIYGAGGYARYIVRPDGEVVLLRWSTRPERIATAERAGIRISD